MSTLTPNVHRRRACGCPHRPRPTAPTKDQLPNVVGFFALARELRDAIYDEMLEEVSITTKQGFKVQATGMVKPHCLTLSRRFSTELLEAKHRAGKLVISDQEDVASGPWDVPHTLPKQALNVRHLHANIRPDPSGQPMCFADQREWVVGVMAQMPLLKTLSIKAVFLKMFDVEKLAQIWRVSRLSKSEVSMQLDVYRTNKRVGHFDFEKQVDIALRWSSAQPRFEPVGGADGTDAKGS